jgi:hypothetical protein
MGAIAAKSFKDTGRPSKEPGFPIWAILARNLSARRQRHPPTERREQPRDGGLGSAGHGTGGLGPGRPPGKDRAGRPRIPCPLTDFKALGPNLKGLAALKAA